jgi:Flp pilus assembly protein TadD
MFRSFILPRRFEYLLLSICLLTLFGCQAQAGPSVPDPALFPWEAAAQFLERGDPQSALEIWQAVLEADPANADAHLQAGLLLALSDPDEAVQHLETAVDLDPIHTSAVTRLAAALRQAGAIDDPAYRDTILGQAFASLEEWHLAEFALENAVAANPLYAEAWAYLGEVRQHTGNGDALDALQTAYTLKPTSYAANLFLSIHYRRLGEPETALPYLQTAIQQDPDNHALQADLAQTLVEAGMVSLGFEQLDTLTEKYPHDPEAWRLLAALSIENNLQVDRTGIPAARQAALLAPEDSQAVLLLGRAYLLLGDTVVAERFFFQAAALDPGSPSPHYFLGILYLNTNKPDQAASHLKSALRLSEQTGDLVMYEQARLLMEKYYP